jgi:HK97 family phage major capsid protein
MTTPNRTLLEKADLAIADLTSDGGLLTTEQTDAFIRLAIKESKLLSMISTTPMASPTKELDKIRFAGRVLQPGAESTALTKAQRSKPDLGKVTLTAKEFKAEVRIGDQSAEDNIERGTFKNTVMTLLSAAVGRDVEWIAINGDTASGTPSLAVLNGFIKQVTTHTVAGGSAHLDKALLKAALKTMPEEFAKVANLAYFTNSQARIDYRDSIADRIGPLGEAMLTTNDDVRYNGIPLHSIPEWPDTTSTSVLLTDPKNMTVGIYQKIRVETDRDISAGELIIVARLRFDVKFIEETATAKITSVATT